MSDYDLIEMAWVLLANVSEGDWTRQPQEWQDAVEKWRDEYHLHLGASLHSPPLLVNPEAVGDAGCAVVERLFKDCVRLRELAGQQTLRQSDNAELEAIANHLHAVAVALEKLAGTKAALERMQTQLDVAHNSLRDLSDIIEEERQKRGRVERQRDSIAESLAGHTGFGPVTP